MSSAIFRTSEFWVGLATALGQVGVMLGFWTQDHFNGVLMPAIVYVIGRITSKVAKSTAKPPVAILGAVLALLVAGPAFAQGERVFKVYAGANAVWYDGAASSTYPSDFEGGLHARASLSPHITLVAAGFRGFKEEYWRASSGVRITATDVQDKGFSAAFGIQYHSSNDELVRPREWAPEAVVGWRPWLETMPRAVVGVGGNYGLTSKQASVYVAARYELFAF